jgi:hypothetical protein
MSYPKAEFYFGETTNAEGAVSRWFFSRDGGAPHFIRIDGKLHPETQYPENTAGNFTLPPESVYVDLAAFWKIAGIEQIQENARAYRDRL